MNKDLPAIIKRIFETPDPIIWNGDWLKILNLLLNDANLTVFWHVLLGCIQNNHSLNFSSISLSKYIKWEIKGFIAQVIKHRISNVRNEKFLEFLISYLGKKNIKIDDNLLLKVISVANKN